LHCERVQLAIRAADLRTAQSDARQLGLSGSGPTGVAAAGLTWREHVEGLVVQIRLASALGDWTGARSGIDALWRCHREQRWARLAVLAHRAEADLATAQGDTQRAQQAEAAAADIAPAPCAPSRVRRTEFPSFEDGSSRSSVIPPPLRSAVPAAASLLTPRETALLELIAAGLSNKQIAWHSKLSEATVKFHIRNIYRKVGARNRVQALARLQRTSTG
jgi:LuxR family maltose regulon positive regulatory protein